MLEASLNDLVVNGGVAPVFSYAADLMEDWLAANAAMEPDAVAIQTHIEPHLGKPGIDADGDVDHPHYHGC